MKETKEANLLRRVLSDPRWPITPEQRAKCIERLAGIIADSADTRAVVAASKALMAADSMNMEQERRDLGIPREGEAGDTLNVQINIGSLEGPSRDNGVVELQAALTAALAHPPADRPLDAGGSDVGYDGREVRPAAAPGGDQPGADPGGDDP